MLILEGPKVEVVEKAMPHLWACGISSVKERKIDERAL